MLSYLAQAAPASPRSGVQYVVGTPPQTPVLRPLRQPLYDTELMANGQVNKVSLFVDNKRFALTGAAKNEGDTNMTQSGQLGYPLEFDLIGFLFEVQRGATRTAHNNIYNRTVWKWSGPHRLAKAA